MRRKRWRRWLVVAFGIAVVARVALGFGLPWLLDRVARTQGWTARVDRTSLSLLGGSLELHGLQLADARAPQTPLVTLAFARADVDVSALLTLSLRVHHLGIEGLRAKVERDAAGAWRWPIPPAVAAAETPEAAAQAPPATTTEPAADDESRALDFRLPIAITSAHVGGVSVEWRDDHVQPPLATELTLAARVHDLGHATRPARVELDVAARDVLDALRVRANARTGERELDVQADIELRGLRPHAVAAYLDAVGLRPRAARGDATLRLDGSLRPRAGDPVGAAGRFEASLQVLADDHEEAIVDGVVVEIEHADRAETRVASVGLRGARATAGRHADGALRLPILDLVPGSAAVPDPATVPPAQAAGPTGDTPATTAAAAPHRVRIAEVRLRDLAATFADAMVQPPANLRLAVPSLEVDRLAFGGEPAADAPPIDLRARVELADALRSLAVTAAWRATRDGGEASVEARGEGVTLSALSPYLTAAGWTPSLRDGTLHLGATARVAGGSDGPMLPVLALDDLHLRDGDDEIVAVDSVRVEGVTVRGGAVEVGRVEVTGSRARVVKDAAGALTALGLRACAPTPAPAAAAAARTAPTTPPNPSPGGAPAFALQELSFRGGPYAWLDLAAHGSAEGAPPVELVLDEVALDLRGLRLADGLPTLDSLAARLRSAQLVDSVVLEAASAVEQRTAVLRGSLRASGIRPDAAMRYARAAGVEPTFATASLHAALDARATASPGGLELSGEVRDVEFATPDAPLVAIPAIRLGPSRLGARTEIGAIEIERPATSLARAADGSLTAAGFRLLPSPAPAAALAAPTAAPTAAPAEPVSAEVPQRDTSPAPSLGPIRITGAEVLWHDAAVEPPIRSGLRLDAAVDAIPHPTAPVHFTAAASVLPDGGSLALEGSFERDRDGGVVLQTGMRGSLQLDRWQAYAPPTVRLEPGVRELEVQARLALGPAAEGGTRLDVQLPVVALRSGSETLAAVRDVAVQVARLDPDAGVVAIDALRVRGVELAAARVDGGTRLLGMTIVPAPPAPPAAEPRAAVEANLTEPAAGAPPRRRTALPTVTLGQLDLEVARVVWRDATAESAVPLTLSARLQHDAPATLLAPDLDELPPVTFHLAAALPPVAESLALDVTWAPAASEPRVEAALAVTGVDAHGLTAVDPALAGVLDAAHSSLAALGARLALGLRLPAGGLAALDPSAGLGAELEVRDLHARDAAGTVLAGVDAVLVDVRRIEPATGLFHVERLEVEGLRGRVDRTADGLSLAGLRLRPARGEDVPVVSVPAEPPRTETPAEPEPEAAAAPATGEVRIDALSVSGLDFAFRDETTTPPVELPLTGLEVEVNGLTSRALREPLSVAFQASLTGGQVSLPRRDESSSVLAGVFGAAGRALTGAEDAHELEQRALFEEIALTSRLQLVPRPAGFVNVDVGALELRPLAGLAASSGVVIGDGVFDGAVRARLEEQGRTRVSMNHVFTDLALSEPANGPISTYLRLPVPLDAVLFALENEDEEHRLPLSFALDEGGVSAAEIGLAATTALGKLVAEALAAAPLRAAGTVTGLLGLSGGEAVPLPPVEVEFAAGALALPDTMQAAVSEALGQLHDVDHGMFVLEHALGTADMPRAAAFANPDPADALAVATDLRVRIAARGRERDLLAAQARREVLTGLDATATLERLRAQETELHTLALALGNALELTRPNAERRAGQRTRSACRALGEQRLAAVREALVRAGGAGLVDRVEIRRPRPETAADAPAHGRVVIRVRPAVASR